MKKGYDHQSAAKAPIHKLVHEAVGDLKKGYSLPNKKIVHERVQPKGKAVKKIIANK